MYFFMHSFFMYFQQQTELEGRNAILLAATEFKVTTTLQLMVED